MRLLIVNDRAQLVEPFREYLRTKTGPDGEVFAVDVETDYVEAVRLITEAGNRYDAVIVDDPPSTGDGELSLDVIRACWKRRLIGVILAARGDLLRCVRVMRAGGWDYIKKDAPDRLLDEIGQSLEAAAEHRRQFKENPDAKWIDEHYDELVATHAGKYVVVHEGQIVESSDSYIEVARAVRAFTRGAPVICHVPKP
jgi:DNA-binding response OmpR family regulator